MINRYVAKSKTEPKKKCLKKEGLEFSFFSCSLQLPEWSHELAPSILALSRLNEAGPTVQLSGLSPSYMRSLWDVNEPRVLSTEGLVRDFTEIYLWMSTKVRADRRPENKRRAETQPLSGRRPAHCTEGSGCNCSHALSCPRSPPVRMLRTLTKLQQTPNQDFSQTLRRQEITSEELDI